MIFLDLGSFALFGFCFLRLMNPCLLTSDYTFDECFIIIHLIISCISFIFGKFSAFVTSLFLTNVWRAVLVFSCINMFYFWKIQCFRNGSFADKRLKAVFTEMVFTEPLDISMYPSSSHSEILILVTLLWIFFDVNWWPEWGQSTTYYRTSLNSSYHPNTSNFC